MDFAEIYKQPGFRDSQLKQANGIKGWGEWEISEQPTSKEFLNYQSKQSPPPSVLTCQRTEEQEQKNMLPFEVAARALEVNRAKQMSKVSNSPPDVTLR